MGWSSAEHPLRATQRSLIALAVLGLSFGSAAASPWLEPGDLEVRSDLETLADSGLLRTPVTTWPTAWGDVAAAVAEARKAQVDERLEPSIARLGALAEAETRTHTFALHAGLAIAERPNPIRTFDDIPRADGEASIGLSWTGDIFAVRLTATGAANPIDGDTFRLDGSYVGMAIGNWMFSIGYPERWWGPGWDGSLILSTNARPPPQIAFNRNSAKPLDIPGFRWVGPWSLSSFMGKLDDERVPENTLLWGLRATARPVPKLEVGLSRTALWCGTDRPCGLTTFIDLLLGKDNAGVNVSAAEQPGDELAGFDLRWTLPGRNAAGAALYLQWIGEDTRRGGPQIGSWLREAGVEFSGAVPRTRWQHRTHFEVADTTCQEGGAGSGGLKPDCAYEHDIYTTGYRYKGRSLGHGIDGDGLAYTIGSTLMGPDDRVWNFSARHMEINRVGAPEAAHTLSPTPQTRTDCSASHSVRVAGGTLTVALGYQRLRDAVAGDDQSWFGWIQFRID